MFLDGGTMISIRILITMIVQKWGEIDSVPSLCEWNGLGVDWRWKTKFHSKYQHEWWWWHESEEVLKFNDIMSLFYPKTVELI
jgi:hypothetical protein